MRYVQFGYNADEAIIPIINGDHFLNKGQRHEIVDDLKILRFKEVNDRPVVAVSLGPHLVGAAAPHVNPGDSKTCALGSIYRIGRKLPNPEYPQYKRRFRRFVKGFLKRKIKPLDVNVDVSVEAWLETTTYSRKRKEDLLKKWESLDLGKTVNWAKIDGMLTKYEELYLEYVTTSKNVQPTQFMEWVNIKSDQELNPLALYSLFLLKCFIKDEGYPESKMARGIYSRSDFAKVILGPYVALASAQIMKQLPEFIKYVPVKDRPDYIKNRMRYFANMFRSTDYTSFEAHFTAELMKDCEMLMFEHVFKNLAGKEILLKLIRWMKFELPNICIFKYFTISIRGKRMSGEMDTSLSNGFSNLMFLYFICHVHGISEDRVLVVVEGDDALCLIFGHIPDDFYAKFGLCVKIEVFENLSEASFCGLVFDEDDVVIIPDIVQTLAELGWTTQKYARCKKSTLKMILRSKALSMLHEYRSCPILTHVGYRLCELTSGIYVRDDFILDYFNQYEAPAVIEARNNVDPKILETVGIKTRLLVEKLKGISVKDQIEIERQAMLITLDKPFHCPELLTYVPLSLQSHYDKFVINWNVNNFNATELYFSQYDHNKDLGKWQPRKAA